MNEQDTAYILDHFSYDPFTGLITREKWSKGSKAPGTVVGAPSPSGTGKDYLVMMVNKRRYYAHRVAWLLMTGEQPPKEVDHIDGNGLNNKWDNLRKADRSSNMKNCRKHRNGNPLMMGISKRPENGKYRARITVNGKTITLGTFSNYVDAVEARKKALSEHGFHENHGS